MFLPNAITTCDGRCFEVRSSDGEVTLDVVSDTYRCRYAPQDGETVLDDPRTIVRLWQELPAVPARGPGLAGIARFSSALLHTLWDFRRYTFAGLLASAGRGSNFDASHDVDALARLLAQFERLCLYVPFRFQCLFRARLLLHFLRRNGMSASWVFGVALFPFDAHCWVVAGDRLLGERAERIARLSPILMIDPTWR